MTAPAYNVICPECPGDDARFFRVGAARPGEIVITLCKECAQIHHPNPEKRIERKKDDQTRGQPPKWRRKSQFYGVGT